MVQRFRNEQTDGKLRAHETFRLGGDCLHFLISPDENSAEWPHGDVSPRSSLDIFGTPYKYSKKTRTLMPTC